MRQNTRKYMKKPLHMQKISCISNYTKRRFLETWGNNFSNVEVVYIGCDQKTFKHKIELEKRKFLSLCRHNQRKKRTFA